jgi:formamidopyrimidine-DNA glycosylase
MTMPELPEVETVARDLQPLVLGKTIQEVWWSGKKLRLPWNKGWDSELKGCTFVEVRRRAKWLVLHLAKKKGLHGKIQDPESPALVAHLGMTGQLTFLRRGSSDGAGSVPGDHVHLRFDLKPALRSGPMDKTVDCQAGELRFRDIRRFGGIHLARNAKELEYFFEKHRLGPEPWDCPLERWQKALSNTNRLIKAVLLDQTVISGVGNIYADESLHAAGIHPCRRCSTLSRAEAARLLEKADSVMRQAIENRGSTIRDYVGGENLNGSHQESLLVYGREGLPCVACGAGVQRWVVSGRSSHFCPRCQKAPRGARKDLPTGGRV